MLPPVAGGGRRWRDHRQVINAILWKLRTGALWRDLPERYGPWKTAHERLRLRTKDGTWARILDEVIVKDDSVGDVGGQPVCCSGKAFSIQWPENLNACLCTSAQRQLRR